MLVDHVDVLDCDSSFKNELNVSRSNLYQECIAAGGDKLFM